MLSQKQVPAAFAGRAWVATTLLSLITLVCYIPALRAGYIWDDDVILTENPLVHSTAGLWSIWFGTQSLDYFPLTLTSFWLEWRLWGPSPAGYHLINVLLHCLAAVLLWRCLRWLTLPQPWLIALLFALHPVAVASVTWIAERKNTLSMVFFLLSLLSYWKFEVGSPSTLAKTARKNKAAESRTTHLLRWYLLSLFCFLCALLSKTSVVILPLILLTCSWWQRGRIDRKDLVRSVPFFVLALTLGLVTLWFQAHRAIGEGDGFRSFPLLDRSLAAGWVLWFYLSKSLLPLNPCMIYPRWQLPPNMLLATLPGALWVLGLVLCWMARKKCGPALLFALGCFTITLLPVLGFFEMAYHQHSRVADHLQYLALIPAMALFVAAVSWITTRWLKPIPAKHCFIATLSAVALCFAVTTWRQAARYQRPATLWSDTVARNPQAWMAWNNLGVALLEENKPAEAVACFEKTISLNPTYSWAEVNLANALAAANRPTEALVHYGKALELAPNCRGAHNNRGIVLLHAGQLEAATADFLAAVTFNPNDAEAQNNLGVALFHQGKYEQAVAAFCAAIQAQPENASNYHVLGRAYLRIERYAEALPCLEKALARDPNHPEACFDLAEVLAHQNKLELAEHYYRRALQSQPGMAEAHYGLGNVLLRQKKPAQALREWREALRLRPDWPELLNDLALRLAVDPDPKLRNGLEAVALAERACQLSPQPSWSLLETLAAAYAEAGRFEDAIKTSQRAIQVAGADRQTSKSQKTLQAYQSHQAWHDSE